MEKETGKKNTHTTERGGARIGIISREHHGKTTGVVGRIGLEI